MGLGESAMTITFDRSICCNLNETISREWLMTNGSGGYAAGTIAGVLTRRQHGLLVAQPPDASIPQLLLTKIDEEVVFDQCTYDLGTNEYRDGTLNPSGFVHLEAFRLEHGFPIFTYRLGGINGMMLEKRIWMPQGRNTTYIQYRLLRTTSTDSSGYRRSGITGALSNSSVRSSEYVETTQHALSITLLPLVTSRPFNQLRHGDKDYHFHVRSFLHEDNVDDDEYGAALSLPPGVAGCTIRDGEQGYPFHIVAVGHPGSQTSFIPTGVWYWNFLHRHDTVDGHSATDDLYLPGVIRSTLWLDEDATLTIIVSSEELSSLPFRLNQLNLSYKRSIEYQQQLLQSVSQPQLFFGEGGEAAQAHPLGVLPLTTSSDPYVGGEEYLHTLLQAADHFLIHRASDRDSRHAYSDSQTCAPITLANFFEMENKTRDTLIALPGLMLATKRYDEALGTLRELARHFKDGLLPDHLPLNGQSLQESDYGSVDTTLWFFYALDHYLRATRNYEFLEDFYQPLVQAIDKYIQGTAPGIHVDASDGLLAASQPGKALTWMNATVDGIAVTPRSGKAVEVNALWYYALSLMLEWSQYLHHASRISRISSHYQELLSHCRHSFQQRFWHPERGYLYDVIDGPDGNDAALRPNQLFALSLRYSVLDTEYRQSVFDVVTRHLLTPLGLRTLAPQDAAYRGRSGGYRQQNALHQGSAWCWLLGPYIDVLLTLRSRSNEMAPLHEERPIREYLWRKGLLLLEPFQERFSKGLLGMCEGVFDGGQPHTPGKNSASVLSTGELLRIYDLLTHIRVIHDDRVLSR